MKNIIFPEFFDYMLNNPYLSSFATSYEQLNDLVVDISSFLDEMLKEDNDQKLQKMADKFAKIHVKLKIEYYFLSDALDYVYDLFLSKKGDVKYDIEKVQKVIFLLKETFGKEYIKHMLSQALESLSSNDERKENFDLLKKFYDFLMGREVKEIGFDHTQCNIGKYIQSMEFVIKSYTVAELRIKFEIEHKKMHEYASMFVSFYTAGRFKEAIIMLDNFIKSSYLVFSLLNEIELIWERNKEHNFARFLHNKITTEKGFVGIVVEPVKNRKIEKFLDEVLYKLKDALKKYQNNFAFLNKNKIYLYFSKNKEYLLIEAIEHFKKELFKIASQYSQKYETIIENPIFRVGLLNTELLEDINFDVIKNIFLIIEEKLEKVKTDEVIVFEDFSSEVFELFELSKAHVHLEKEVIEIIKNRDFSIFAQKLVNTQTQEVEAVEILSRVKENRKFVSASIFLNIVEKNSLTLDMDIAVFDKVARNLEKISKITKKMFINIFPTSLNSNEFLKMLKNLVKKAEEFEIEVVVELTEHTLIDNFEKIRALESKNLQIAFDDFGSGFTNFERVGKLADLKETKVLKIDGEIVKYIKDSKVYMSMVKSISSFAKDVDLEVVYEFVEDKETYDILKELSKKLGLKSYIQGYYFYKPELVV
jgi:EAL domain-containing protein (putative c-di-GMP-specific phosphodiesterase class I)